MKRLLFMLGGFVIGGAAGILGTKKYFQDKYQKRYEDDYAALEEYYHRTDEYARGDHEEEEFEDDGINSPEVDSHPNGRMTEEERAEIKKKLNKNWEATTNYAGMYKEKSRLKEQERIICENCEYFDYDENYCNLVEEAVNWEDSCSDFISNLSEDSDTTPEEEAFENHQKNKDKPPKIISAETYSELPASIDQNVLYFYIYDEVLCDDNEEEVEEPEVLIGDALTKYDFIDSNERIIFVMNYAQNTCYEIQKVDASWTDSH